MSHAFWIFPFPTILKYGPKVLVSLDFICAKLHFKYPVLLLHSLNPHDSKTFLHRSKITFTPT